MNPKPAIQAAGADRFRATRVHRFVVQFMKWGRHDTAMIYESPLMIKAARLADRRNWRILAVFLISFSSESAVFRYACEYEFGHQKSDGLLTENLIRSPVKSGDGFKRMSIWMRISIAVLDEFLEPVFESMKERES